MVLCRCTAWEAAERPSLGSEVLPALSRLVGRAEGAAAQSSKAAEPHDAEPPAFLLCPITQVIDPCYSLPNPVCEGLQLLPQDLQCPSACKSGQQ